jgi:hypothetical protein
MKLMTTRQGEDGLETHINNVFLLIVFFVIVASVSIAVNLPSEIQAQQAQCD